MFIKSATVLDFENMIEYVTHQPTEHQQQVRCTRNGRTIGETLTCLDQLSHILFLVDIGSTLDHVMNDYLKNHFNSQGIWTRNIGRLAIIWLVYTPLYDIYIYNHILTLQFTRHMFDTFAKNHSSSERTGSHVLMAIVEVCCNFPVDELIKTPGWNRPRRPKCWCLPAGLRLTSVQTCSILNTHHL